MYFEVQTKGRGKYFFRDDVVGSADLHSPQDAWSILQLHL